MMMSHGIGHMQVDWTSMFYSLCSRLNCSCVAMSDCFPSPVHISIAINNIITTHFRNRLMKLLLYVL